MPRYDTPEPITAVLDLVVGDVDIAATDRHDTTVEVTPTDPGHEPDVRAAEQTRVEYADGRLLIKAPKQRRNSLFGKPGSIDLKLGLPSGSHLRAEASVSAFRCAGRLGNCRLKTTAGNLHVEQATDLVVRTGAGAVVVDRATGAVEITTGSGAVDLGSVDGAAVVKNSNGQTTIRRAGGEIRVNSANGGISIGHAPADVTAHTANGDITIDELVRGVTSLRTAFGRVEVGIRAGTAARLDAHTRFGTVRSHLDAVEHPAPTDESVDVHARTSYGDIVVDRCPTHD